MAFRLAIMFAAQTLPGYGGDESARLTELHHAA